VRNHVGFALNRGDAALHMDLVFLDADLRFDEPGANIPFDSLGQVLPQPGAARLRVFRRSRRPP
jgi:hypothetical protein